MITKKDYRAIYIHCDGSMMPDSKSSGGIGFVIKFPDELELEEISDFEGVFHDANIERLEIQAIIEGMDGLLSWIKHNPIDISWISKIIIITDRFDLKDDNRTSPFRISDWRKNGGKNFEGKEIKNWDLLNSLDKIRTKLRHQTKKSVRIEYRPRKQNKDADRLSKKGRKDGIPNRKIAIEGHKIGKRKFDGPEINYSQFGLMEYLEIHVFRKRPLKDQWEVNVEILSEKKKGHKLKIVTDHILQERLQRGNAYEIRIKKIYTYHIEIYRTIKKISKDRLHQLSQ